MVKGHEVRFGPVINFSPGRSRIRKLFKPCTSTSKKTIFGTTVKWSELSKYFCSSTSKWTKDASSVLWSVGVDAVGGENFNCAVTHCGLYQ